MLRRYTTIAGALLLMSLGACATVSVYEPDASVEVSLEGPGANLQRASRRYCETARNRGLAAGEASLQGLAGSIFGTEAAAAPYWKRIGADSVAPSAVLRRVRTDASEIASGLVAVNVHANRLMADTRPTRDDLLEFERVLIHARQARESLAEALSMSSYEGGAETHAPEIRTLDRALAEARKLADDMAEARAHAPEDEPLVMDARNPARG